MKTTEPKQIGFLLWPNRKKKLLPCCYTSAIITWQYQQDKIHNIYNTHMKEMAEIIVDECASLWTYHKCHQIGQHCKNNALAHKVRYDMTTLPFLHEAQELSWSNNRDWMEGKFKWKTATVRKYILFRVIIRGMWTRILSWGQICGCPRHFYYP